MKIPLHILSSGLTNVVDVLMSGIYPVMEDGFGAGLINAVIQIQIEIQ
jgi:hypothetical protein